MRARIMALEFDHDLLRLYPGGAPVCAHDMTSDSKQLHAAIEQLDHLEGLSSDLSSAQTERLAAMVRSVCGKKRRATRNTTFFPPPRADLNNP